MTILSSGDKKVLVDEEGFLDESQMWDEEIAQILAENEGVDDLDEEKMDIIKYLRKHYAKHGSFPILGKVCRGVGDKSKDCVNREFIDPMKAWKIAGLPKPPNIFFTSFDGEHYVPNPVY